MRIISRFGPDCAAGASASLQQRPDRPRGCRSRNVLVRFGRSRAVHPSPAHRRSRPAPMLSSPAPPYVKCGRAPLELREVYARLVHDSACTAVDCSVKDGRRQAWHRLSTFEAACCRSRGQGFACGRDAGRHDPNERRSAKCAGHATLEAEIERRCVSHSCSALNEMGLPAPPVEARFYAVFTASDVLAILPGSSTYVERGFCEYRFAARAPTIDSGHLCV